MRVVRILAIAVCIMLASAFAISAKSAEIDDKIKLAEKLSNKDYTDSLIEALVPAMFQAMEPLIRNQKGPKIKQDEIAKLKHVTEKVMKERFGEFQKDIAQLYANHFEIEELKAIVDFRESEVGRKLTSFQPQVVQQSTILVQQWIKKIEPQLKREIKKALGAKKI